MQMDNTTTLLSDISSLVRQEYAQFQKNSWVGSPFAWILTFSSRTRGAIGERLIARWCESQKLRVSRSPDTDADILINGHRVEIKFSSLWSNGVYNFQQIRDQRYEYLLCLGVSPFRVHAWITDKRDIPFSKLKHQHGGARGHDTWWIIFKPNDPPDWLGKQPGTLDFVSNFFTRISQKQK